MSRNVKIYFVLLLCLATPVLMASHTNIVGINVLSPSLFNAVTISGNSSQTSTADTSIGRSEHQSVQYRVTSAGGHDVAITVQTTLDETNWATPDSGATVVAHVTDSLWHSAILSTPVAKDIRFVGTTTNATSAVITLMMGAQ